MRLKKETWLTTGDAVEMLRGFLPSVTPRWFQSGRYRCKQFAEPRRIGDRLYWNERELQQWLVRRGLTEWCDL